MGIIKTAMIGGTALYGISQVTKIAQSRNNSQPSQRREYSDRDQEYYRQRPLEFRDRASAGQPYVDTRDGQYRRPTDNREPRQRLYLEDERYPDYQQYYAQTQYDDRPQYEYASNSRSQSASPPYYSNQRQPQGFVEPEEIVNDTRGPERGNGTDMINMLAQQAMNSGLVGGKKGKKDKDSKGDLLSSLISR